MIIAEDPIHFPTSQPNGGAGWNTITQTSAKPADNNPSWVTKSHYNCRDHAN